jgi:uncharacterized protein (DUF1778 family)
LNTLQAWADLGTLTDFVVTAVQEKANTIIQQHDNILASEKARKFFFDALMNPQGPDEKLREAAQRYKLFIQENQRAVILRCCTLH